MNKQEQEQFFTEFSQKQKDILLKKGDDYSGEDRLSNFKFAGQICGISAQKNCLSLIATKVARLGQLTDSKTPKNESLEDSLLDLANYAILMAMIIKDKENDTK